MLAGTPMNYNSTAASHSTYSNSLFYYNNLQLCNKAKNKNTKKKTLRAYHLEHWSLFTWPQDQGKTDIKLTDMFQNH